LHGKNVAVVGTDASAIQFVPQIAPRAGKLSLFQRATALVCAARGFSHRSQVAAALPSFPPLIMRAFRQCIFSRQEFRVLGFLGNRFVRGKATEIATHHLEKQISDRISVLH